MNYYKKIAEMLGVELGEEFSIKNIQTDDINRARYKITKEKGLMYSIGGEEWNRSSSLLAVFSGAYSIVKLPWKPKKGEAYWHYSEVWREVISFEWEDCLYDFLLWKAGNCFKTKEEGDAKAKEIIEKLRKEYEAA